MFEIILIVCFALLPMCMLVTGMLLLLGRMKLDWAFALSPLRHLDEFRSKKNVPTRAVPQKVETMASRIVGVALLAVGLTMIISLIILLKRKGG